MSELGSPRFKTDPVKFAQLVVLMDTWLQAGYTEGMVRHHKWENAIMQWRTIETNFDGCRSFAADV